MRLYIGNASTQNIVICYRIPTKKTPVFQSIPIGSQIRIPMELDQKGVDNILDQLQKYGLVTVAEAEKVRGEFGGMIYGIDRPLTSDDLSYSRTLHMAGLKRRGQKTRQEAALAVTEVIQNKLPQGMELRETEFIVQEEDRKASDENTTERVAEGIIVSRDADHGPPHGAGGTSPVLVSQSKKPRGPNRPSRRREA